MARLVYLLRHRSFQASSWWAKLGLLAVFVALAMLAIVIGGLLLMVGLFVVSMMLLVRIGRMLFASRDKARSIDRVPRHRRVIDAESVVWRRRD
jgi:uncharacterized protein (DUF58 family)